VPLAEEATTAPAHNLANGPGSAGAIRISAVARAVMTGPFGIKLRAPTDNSKKAGCHVSAMLTIAVNTRGRRWQAGTMRGARSAWCLAHSRAEVSAQGLRETRHQARS
jgi:hypothetical protein